MPTFYHGTATTFEPSILEHGLRKSRCNRWNALATNELGGPADLGLPGAVWITENFQLATMYARWKAKLLHAKEGEFVTISKLADPDWGVGRALLIAKLIKVVQFCDPFAEPIVLAVEIADDEGRAPAGSRTERVLDAIPPGRLSGVRLRQEISFRITAVDGAVIHS
jgi:hypothetical protein